MAESSLGSPALPKHCCSPRAQAWDGSCRHMGTCVLKHVPAATRKLPPARCSGLTPPASSPQQSWLGSLWLHPEAWLTVWSCVRPVSGLLWNWSVSRTHPRSGPSDQVHRSQTWPGPMSGEGQRGTHRPWSLSSRGVSTVPSPARPQKGEMILLPPQHGATPNLRPLETCERPGRRELRNECSPFHPQQRA